MNQPNIFNYATSELTQDAFITWLLQWANPIYKTENEKLHELGTSFLASLLAKQNIILTEIENFDVESQFYKIDVFVRFTMQGKTYGIIIEDKVHSGDHSNQLQRYKAKISALNSCEIIVGIYFKTGYQVNFNNVIENDYHHYSVKDFLTIVNQASVTKINNDILTQYHSYLLEKEKDFDLAHASAENYVFLPIKQWNWWSCVKFFHTHKNHFNAKWTSVANNREPLLAFWFGGKKFKVKRSDGISLELTLYVDIQFAREKLIVAYRLGLNGHEQKNSEVRNLVYNAFVPLLQKHNIENKKPKFTSARDTIKLAQITNLDSSIHYQEFVRQLEKYQKVVDIFVENFNQEELFDNAQKVITV
jgi:hypothetical protein